jgi:diguanylate cyclase (GGDEF)-like protein/PAS domain S-box-containing protein
VSEIFVYTPDLWLFILSAIVQSGLAVFAWQQRGSSLGRVFFRLMLCTLIWTAGFAVETAAQPLALKVWLARVQFIGITFLPLVWLRMIFAFTGKTLLQRHWALLALPPTLTLVLIWLVPAPNWFWGPFRLDFSAAPFPVLDSNYHFWFYAVHAASGYLYLALAVFFLLRSLPALQPVYRRQAGLLLAALLLPAATDVLYVLGFSPIRYYNFTSAVFGLSGLLVTWALYRYSFLDLAPLARDLVIENLGDAIIVLDMRNRFVDFNPAARQVAQLSAEVVGQPVESMQSLLLQTVDDLCRRGIERADIEVGEVRKVTFDVRITPVCGRDSHPLGKVVALRDISERVELLRQMQELATRDSLTGACTRRYFLELGQLELERLDRQPGRALSVGVLDLDNFKQVNDTWGHAAGDQALAALADLCGEQIRATDLLGRMGGDEFAILFPDTGPDGAAVVAERIRSEMEGRRIATPDGEVALTVSLGIASVQTGDEQACDLDHLLNLADRALYQAKQAGRNRVEVV